MDESDTMEIAGELKQKALACETAEELLALAAENGIELSAAEAETILQKSAEVFEGELSDEELDSVSGGEASLCERNAHEVVYYKSCIDVEFLFNIGDIKQAFVGAKMGSETATVRITESKTQKTVDGWIDVYKYDRISGAPTVFGFDWQKRSRFEK